MKLDRLAGGECINGKDCPAIYATKDGNVLVQGYSVQDHVLDPPAGEAVVAIPLSVLVEAASRAVR